ncbi:outer membrane beta-barrel protein [Kinneretia asaccharophila]|uniref:Outer membrane protein with beta-barrel domain n=1 Tax=Roseateles asaccharophilus TaxID=582607 RepID=A0A4R6N8P0_9BURK|nr:outer membrane beta-barrel protein [Roseateles asaccharophilus]MDN3545096.1 outer membrane beta-barrel protein [Roseateles asaccharophilus]TDP11517.1 outer membrane protein with beta-barrel domain [Roseateles asaccharophilus]
MKKIIALAAIAALSTVAQADGFYIGGDVGKSRISDEGLKFKGTSYALFGGYNFSDNVAVELGYRNLGKDTITIRNVPFTLKGNALQVSAVLSAPLGSDFSVFGRLGVNRLEGKLTFPGGAEKETLTRALIGFGARYAISKEFGLRAEFQKAASDTQVFTFGADYRF